MDVWKVFGIEYVSPSHLTAWAQDRGQWFAKQRRKLYEDAGPAAWRGDAVEAGLYSALWGKGAPGKIAHDKFELLSLEWAKKHDGEIHPGADDEEAVIDRTLERAIRGWEAEKLPQPIAYQIKAEGFLPRTRVKVYGKPDFAIRGAPSGPALPFCVDLKTTNRMPGEPKKEHAIAASIYANLRGEDHAGIFYTSTAEKPKDGHRLFIIEPEAVAFYTRAATEIIRQMEATLTAAVAMSEFEIVSPEEALAQLCRPNMLAEGGGTFAIWKEEYASRVLAAVPEWN